jgi:hemoglobin-like flavoprotein
MITDGQKRAIVSSWRLVVPIADTAADLFYKRLFELKPEFRALFPDNMDRQKQKLVRMLEFIVKALDFPESAWRQTVRVEDDLFLVIVALGRRHSELYRVLDEYYAPVGEALIWALDYGLGDAFTDEVRAAWIQIYGLLAMTMKMGGRAGVEPASASYRN